MKSTHFSVPSVKRNDEFFILLPSSLFCLNGACQADKRAASHLWAWGWHHNYFILLCFSAFQSHRKSERYVNLDARGCWHLLNNPRGPSWHKFSFFLFCFARFFPSLTLPSFPNLIVAFLSEFASEARLNAFFWNITVPCRGSLFHVGEVCRVRGFGGDWGFGKGGGGAFTRLSSRQPLFYSQMFHALGSYYLTTAAFAHTYTCTCPSCPCPWGGREPGLHGDRVVTVFPIILCTHR